MRLAAVEDELLLADGPFEGEVPARRLELLHQVGRALVEHPEPVLDQPQPETSIRFRVSSSSASYSARRSWVGTLLNAPDRLIEIAFNESSVARARRIGITKTDATNLFFSSGVAGRALG